MSVADDQRDVQTPGQRRWVLAEKGLYLVARSQSLVVLADEFGPRALRRLKELQPRDMHRVSG